jgi:hypothetical protein
LAKRLEAEAVAAEKARIKAAMEAADRSSPEYIAARKDFVEKAA